MTHIIRSLRKDPRTGLGRSRRAMSLIEVVLAVFIFVVATLVLFRAFTANKRLSVQSRDRTAAQLLMGNLLEEVRAHPFGLPAPVTWPPNNPPSKDWESAGFPEAQSIPAFVEGNAQKMVFHRQLAYEGSLVGKGKSNHDVVTATISWKDPGQPRLSDLQARLVVRRR
jgi:Tfp pilus assembly protein PilV